MKEDFTTQVMVNGKGATRQQAFAAALGQVQSSLLKDNPRVMLRIEPLEVRVLKAEESVRVEKFLREFNFEVRHSPMPPDGTLRIP